MYKQHRSKIKQNQKINVITTSLLPLVLSYYPSEKVVNTTAMTPKGNYSLQSHSNPSLKYYHLNFFRNFSHMIPSCLNKEKPNSSLN